VGSLNIDANGPSFPCPQEGHCCDQFLLLVPNVKVPEQQRFILHHISCSLRQEHVAQVERKITLGQHWPRWAPVCRFLESRPHRMLVANKNTLAFLSHSSARAAAINSVGWPWHEYICAPRTITSTYVILLFSEPQRSQPYSWPPRYFPLWSADQYVCLQNLATGYNYD
jgi:hypothetical protein